MLDSAITLTLLGSELSVSLFFFPHKTSFIKMLRRQKVHLSKRNLIVFIRVLVPAYILCGEIGKYKKLSRSRLEYVADLKRCICDRCVITPKTPQIP